MINSRVIKSILLLAIWSSVFAQEDSLPVDPNFSDAATYTILPIAFNLQYFEDVNEEYTTVHCEPESRNGFEYEWNGYSGPIPFPERELDWTISMTEGRQRGFIEGVFRGSMHEGNFCSEHSNIRGSKNITLNVLNNIQERKLRVKLGYRVAKRGEPNSFLRPFRDSDFNLTTETTPDERYDPGYREFVFNQEQTFSNCQTPKYLKQTRDGEGKGSWREIKCFTEVAREHLPEKTFVTGWIIFKVKIRSYKKSDD